MSGDPNFRLGAAARLAAWNNDNDDVLPKNYTPDSLVFQLDLRAVLIERELIRKLLEAVLQTPDSPSVMLLVRKALES